MKKNNNKNKRKSEINLSRRAFGQRWGRYCFVQITCRRIRCRSWRRWRLGVVRGRKRGLLTARRFRFDRQVRRFVRWRKRLSQIRSNVAGRLAAFVIHRNATFLFFGFARLHFFFLLLFLLLGREQTRTFRLIELVQFAKFLFEVTLNDVRLFRCAKSIGDTTETETTFDREQ